MRSAAAMSSGPPRASRNLTTASSRSGLPTRLPVMTSSPETPPVPQPHATAEQVEAARHDSKLAQVLYHDWEAESYDDKWSLSYDQRCIDYARGGFAGIVGEEAARGRA